MGHDPVIPGAEGAQHGKPGLRPSSTASRTITRSAVSAGCATKATIRAARRRDRRVWSIPSSRTLPVEGVSTPATSRSSIDFPEPLEPTRPKVLPLRTCNAMSCPMAV